MKPKVVRGAKKSDRIQKSESDRERALTSIFLEEQRCRHLVGTGVEEVEDRSRNAARSPRLSLVGGGGRTSSCLADSFDGTLKMAAIMDGLARTIVVVGNSKCERMSGWRMERDGTMGAAFGLGGVADGGQRSARCPSKSSRGKSLYFTEKEVPIS